MLAFTANIAACLFYVLGSGYAIALLIKRHPIDQPWLLSLAACAIALHGVGAYGAIVQPDGLALGVYKISSLIFWVINALVLLSGLRKPLHSLFALLLPLSALAVFTSLVGQSPTWEGLQGGIGGHVLLSILAYSLLTLAALQAVAMGWQNHRLKEHQLTGLVRLLPPLQTMESLMFELVWVGELLLTLAIVTGAIFIDNIFAQHLVHKTVLSILAWLIFALLLWGRYHLGWRGNVAVRWVLGGFCLLMLGYFGSKIVLEVILNGG